MAEVIVVRHAEPALEPAVPAERWHLSANGRIAARRLAEVLPPEPFAVTSDEPKARETAHEMLAARGGTLVVDPRVGETRRPHRWDANFAALARQFVGGRRHDGWEAQAAVARRFDAAVRAGMARSRGNALVVFNHGQALTLWLAHIGAIDDAPGFWSELTFPDAWSVSVRNGSRVAATGSPVRLAPTGTTV